MKPINELIAGQSLYSICKNTDVQVTQLSRWVVMGALVDVDGMVFIPAKTKSEPLQDKLAVLYRQSNG